MLEEFAIPKHGVHRGGLREADTNITCTAGTHSSSHLRMNAALSRTFTAFSSNVDILDDLTENNATYITEDDNYERCEELVRYSVLHSDSAAADVSALYLEHDLHAGRFCDWRPGNDQQWLMSLQLTSPPSAHQQEVCCRTMNRHRL